MGIWYGDHLTILSPSLEYCTAQELFFCPHHHRLEPPRWWMPPHLRTSNNGSSAKAPSNSHARIPLPSHFFPKVRSSDVPYRYPREEKENYTVLGENHQNQSKKQQEQSENLASHFNFRWNVELSLLTMTQLKWSICRELSGQLTCHSVRVCAELLHVHHVGIKTRLGTRQQKKFISLYRRLGNFILTAWYTILLASTCTSTSPANKQLRTNWKTDTSTCNPTTTTTTPTHTHTLHTHTLNTYTHTH